MIDNTNIPVHGNAQVIALLEAYLAKARLGHINYGMVAVCELPDKGDYDVAGSTEMEDVALVALDLIRKRIESSRVNRSMPDRDSNAPADRVCFNCAGGLGFDFLPWLIDAEMTRVREGAPAPLKVAFFMGRDGGKNCLNTRQRKQMFHCVMRPMLKLIGAVEDASAMNGRSKPLVHHQDIIAAHKAGEPTPRLQPSAAGRCIIKEFTGGRQPVTITLREAGHFSNRNSNLDAWIKFAKVLQSCGEDVVIVRDTARAFDPIPGLRICPLASINIDVRCALYKAARCNLFVSNGPHVMALFGSRPWLTFIEIDEVSEYEPLTSKWWRESCGIEAGSQFPWCGPDQRIIWKRDDYHNLVQAWAELTQQRLAA